MPKRPRVKSAPLPISIPTTWTKHKAKWSECKECDLCQNRKFAVLGRGNIPADVLIVGLAPGDAENLLGKPFIGPAGKLLDSIWDDAVAYSGVRNPPRTAITTLVACYPKETDPEKWKKNRVRDPNSREIRSCQNRLKEFAALTRAKYLVTVGNQAARWAPPIKDDWLGICEIEHPSSLFRLAKPMQELNIERLTIRISNFLSEHFT